MRHKKVVQAEGEGCSTTDREEQQKSSRDRQPGVGDGEIANPPSLAHRDLKDAANK